MAGHLANDVFGEGAGLAGDSDEHGGFDVANDVEERDVAGVGELPSCNVGFLAHEGLLVGDDALDAFDEEAVAVDGVEAAASLLFGEASLFQGCEHQVGDADACGTEAEEEDGLILERNASGVDGGEQGCGGDGCGALDVVVEGA